MKSIYHTSENRLDRVALLRRMSFILIPLFILLSCGGQEREVPETGYETWNVYGGDAGFSHYSRLDQINRSNVHRLEVAWTFDSGDAFPESELQSNPIIIGNMLYSVTPQRKTFALNAATGELVWSFDPSYGAGARGLIMFRSVSYWTDDTDKRIFTVFKNYLYALDAMTGEPVAGFGNGGRVDMRENLGRPVEEVSITASSPGVIYKDLIIMGSKVSERLPAPPGDIRAYDVRTGELRWTFHTIPRPGEPGYETWPEDAWLYTGGANSWGGMSLDEERGIVFVPTGSASFDFYGANRLGDNLYANCLLALKADTGELVWYFQLVKHDVWDRDLPTPPALVTVERDGQLIDAVAQPSKYGSVLVFDRETGESLFPLEEINVPPSDVEGEVLSETQIMPLEPPPFARQIFTEDMVTDRTSAAHDDVLNRLRSMVSGPQFTPPSTRGTIVFPGLDGGPEWGGPAFDPETGLLYVNSNEMAWITKLVENSVWNKMTNSRELYETNCASCHKTDMSGSPPNFPSLLDLSELYDQEDFIEFTVYGAGRMPAYSYLTETELEAIARFVLYGEEKEVDRGRNIRSPYELKYLLAGYNKFLDPEGYPAMKPPWGTLNALDLDTGDYRWQIPFGEYPELAAQGMTNTGSENYGGPVVTAGGLLFIGATVYDNKFHAFDKLTGELLWETTLPYAAIATPAIYEVGGRQFIVVAAGGGKGQISGYSEFSKPQPSGALYVAFALPE